MLVSKQRGRWLLPSGRVATSGRSHVLRGRVTKMADLVWHVTDTADPTIYVAESGALRMHEIEMGAQQSHVTWSDVRQAIESHPRVHPTRTWTTACQFLRETT